MFREKESDNGCLGTVNRRLEQQLAVIESKEFVVTFCSAVAAWEAVYLAAGVSQNAEIVLSPLAPLAAARALVSLQAVPVFADVWPDTLNIKPKALEMGCSRKTTLLVVNDFAGHPADMASIKRIAQSYQVVVAEDISLSLGCIYQEAPVGALADMLLVSFAAFTGGKAQGAAVLTDNGQLYEKLLFYRRWGLTGGSGETNVVINRSVVDEFALAPSDAAGAAREIGSLEFLRQQRSLRAAALMEGLKGSRMLKLPTVQKKLEAGWTDFVVRVSGRDRASIIGEIEALGIDFRLPAVPLYLLKHFLPLGYDPELFPVAQDYYLQGIIFPLQNISPPQEMADLAGNLTNILS